MDVIGFMAILLAKQVKTQRLRPFFQLIINYIQILDGAIIIRMPFRKTVIQAAKIADNAESGIDHHHCRQGKADKKFAEYRKVAPYRLHF